MPAEKRGGKKSNPSSRKESIHKGWNRKKQIVKKSFLTTVGGREALCRGGGEKKETRSLRDLGGGSLKLSLLAKEGISPPAPRGEEKTLSHTVRARRKKKGTRKEREAGNGNYFPFGISRAAVLSGGTRNKSGNKKDALAIPNTVTVHLYPEGGEKKGGGSLRGREKKKEKGLGKGFVQKEKEGLSPRKGDQFSSNQGGGVGGIIPSISEL